MLKDHVNQHRVRQLLRSGLEKCDICVKKNPVATTNSKPETYCTFPMAKLIYFHIKAFKTVRYGSLFQFSDDFCSETCKNCDKIFDSVTSK